MINFDPAYQGAGDELVKYERTIHNIKKYTCSDNVFFGGGDETKSSLTVV